MGSMWLAATSPHKQPQLDVAAADAACEGAGRGHEEHMAYGWLVFTT
jgi:hypothetical protein